MTSEEAAAKVSRGPYKNGVKRRQQIVKAAAAMFGRYGYQGASLRAIAERVGTTPATLIAYFTNKEGLLVAVLEYWRKESDPTTSLYVGLDHFRAFLQLMRYHEQHRGLIELFLTMSVEASDEAHPAHDFIVERQRQTLEDMIRNFAAAVESGQIRPMRPEAIETEARLLIATLDGIELQWILDRSVDLEATVRTFVDASIARWSGRPLAVVATETDAWLTEHDQQPGRAEPHPASSHKKRG